MFIVFKGGTVGIAGHCVVTGDIGNAVSIHYTLYLAIIANLAGERFSSLLGVGLVFSAVTSEGIESFIAQVGGGVVLSIGCGTLDALAFYSQSTLVFLTICIGSFGPSGSAVFIVVDRAFFFAAIFRADGFLVGGDFTGCHFRAGIYFVVTYNTFLVHVDFIHIQLAVNGQGTANGSVTSGCQGTGLDISGFHCAVGLDKTAACIETFNSCVSCFQGAFHFCIAGNVQGATDCSFASGFQGTRFHSFSDYISICAHCKVISSHSQCTRGELSAYSSIIGNLQGIAFQMSCCFNTSSFQLVGYVHTSCRNFICERTGSACNGGAGNDVTGNTSCRGDIMDIQISILEGSYTVCQFISGDSTVACIDITSVGTKCSTLGIDVSATSLNKTSIGFNVAVHAQVASHFCSALNGQVASGCHTGDIYYEFTIAYVQSTACFYISGSVQICHLCFGFLYIISFYVFFRRIGLHNGISITILGGFDCACYVVYDDRFRLTTILSHHNHIGRVALLDIRNICCHFTQYAASCE